MMIAAQQARNQRRQYVGFCVSPFTTALPSLVAAL
jgi:hypothetical protein